jgi:hypothetical protein
MLGDAGVAREQHVDTLLEQPERTDLDAVRFREALRNVEGNVDLKIAQQRHEQRRGRLPVRVEVAPHGNLLPARDGAIQPIGGGSQVGQIERRGGRIAIGIEESPGSLRCGDAVPRQQLRHDRITADGAGQRWIDCQGFRKDPH